MNRVDISFTSKASVPLWVRIAFGRCVESTNSVDIDAQIPVVESHLSLEFLKAVLLVHNPATLELPPSAHRESPFAVVQQSVE
jgi:hypothetical protein